VSPPLTLRPPARARRRRTVPLSPWHYLAAGLVALVGTGMIAVLDRSKNGNGGHAAAPNGKGEGVQVVRAIESPAKTPVAGPARGPVSDIATQSTTRAPSPASAGDTAPRGGAEARTVSAAPVRSLFAAAPAPEESSAPPPEGPAATASVAAAPAPPPRQAVTPAPPPATAAQAGTAALQAAVTRRSVTVNANAPTDCLPDEIRALLADLGAQFGPITIVSTNKHLTGNHSAGSPREKLHVDCKAVDFKPDRHRVDAIRAYLRGRAEVGSIDSYRSGVMHIDFKETRSAARATPATRAAAAPSAAAVLEAPAEQPAAPPQQPPSLFTPGLPPWLDPKR
jgi:hypothetical protein